MIISFYVENFGSIKDRQTLSFEADKSEHLEDYYVVNAGKNLRLLKLALIYGSNASGKTILLKALDFLNDIVSYPLSQKYELLKFEPFLLDENTPKQNTIMGIEFIQSDIRYDYEVEFNRHAILREELYNYNPKKAIVYKRHTDVDKQLTEVLFGNKIKLSAVSKKTLEANTLWNNTVLGGFLKTNIDLYELREVNSWFNSCLGRLVHPDINIENLITEFIAEQYFMKEALLQMLKKADFNINDIIFRKEGDKYVDIKVEHLINEKKYLIPFDEESRGTQRFYTLALWLYLLVCPETRVVVIDELESSLHPDLFEYFLITFLLNSKQSQLIATTHNREILNNKDLFRNDAVWITDRKEDCSTELYSLADFDSSVIRDSTNIFKAYKSGKLGGVPNLGDYYLDLEE